MGFLNKYTKAIGKNNIHEPIAIKTNIIWGLSDFLTKKFQYECPKQYKSIKKLASNVIFYMIF